MYGTSRRQGAAFWVMRLSQNHDIAEMRIGMTFISDFRKNLNAGDHHEKSIG
jgi:hypothetical protein